MDKEKNLNEEIKVDRDELAKKTSREDLKKIMKDASDILGIKEDYSDLKIMSSFRVGRKWWRNGKSSYEKKEMNFAFIPSDEERAKWEIDAFPKLSSLLTYLKNKYGSLTRFEVIFFRDNKPKSFYFEDLPTITNVYVNLNSYQKYHSVINPEINQLKISKYFRRIIREYSKKVPVAFFKNKPPSSLVEDLRKSNYKVIENIIKEYETMGENEKKDLKTILLHSKLANDTVEEFKKLKPKSPEKQLKLFMKVIDKLSKKEIELLWEGILKSKSSRNLISVIGELSSKDQSKISKNLPEMARMYCSNSILATMPENTHEFGSIFTREE